MERLTEEKQIGPFASLKDKAEAVPGAFATYDCLYAHMVAVTRLKEYEDAMPLERAKELAQAEQDGRLVVLPVKEGTTIYRVRLNFDGDRYEIIEKDFDLARFRPEDFGRIVFQTREEAEAELKKREDGDD